MDSTNSNWMKITYKLKNLGYFFVHSEKSILSSCQVHQLCYLLVYSMKTLVLAFILFHQKCQQNKISN